MVVLIELGLLLKRKSTVSKDIGIIVYVVLILWEYFTAKVGMKNAMLYPVPENVFNVIQKITPRFWKVSEVLFVCWEQPSALH